MSSVLEFAAGPMQRIMTEPWAVRLLYEMTTDSFRSASTEYSRLADAALEELDELDRAVRALDGLAAADQGGAG